MNEVESLNVNASFYLNDELLLKFNKDSVDKNLTVVPIDKEGPSYDNWYHGRMSRETSEQLLRKAAKPGGFLIRESERKPRCFVLSYLSLDSNIHHFKIKPIYGVYFIGLRHFDKLETLVSYYMYYSELVEGEKLLNPIEPERITRIESVYMSIKTLDKQNTHHDRTLNGHDSPSATTKITTNNSSVLDIDRIGSYFRVFHEIDNGEWLWAQSLLTNDYGLLKTDCVRRIDDDKLHELEPWYYSNISKEDAVSILADAGNSSYLVRPSEQSTGDYTLFFNADNVVHRFRITGCRISEPCASSLLISSSSSSSSSSTSSSSSSSSLSVLPQLVGDQELITRRYFNIGGRNYTSISCIIDRYMNEDITDGYRLTKLPHKHVCIGDEQSYFANVVYNFNAKTNAEQLDSAAANLKNYFDMSSSSLNEENSRKFDNQKAGADQQPPMSSAIQPSTSPPKQQQPNVQVDLSKPNGNNKKISKSISSPLSSVTLGTQNQQPTSNGSKQLKGLVSGQQFFLNKTTNDPTSTSSLSSSSTSSSSNSSTQPAQSNTLNCSLPSSVLATKLANTTSTSATPTGATIKTAAVPNSSTGAPNFIKNSVTNGLKKSLGHSKSAVPSSLKKNQNLDSCLVLKGYLNKYNEKTKKWKLYYFTINQNNQQLFYYSNEKSTKEKGIIDLSRGFYYPVDDSFFNRSFCFQIVIQSYAANLNGNNHSNHNFTNFNVHYLSAENLNSFKEWTENIRPLCNPIQYNPFYGKQANCLLTSSRSSSSLSLSSSSSSSSPLNISLSQTHPPMLMKTAVQQQQQQYPQMNGNNKLTSPPHLPPPTAKTQLSHSCSSSLNYRILRTLSVDLHEARNVCFSPITGGGSLSTSAEPGSFRGQIPCTAINPSLISQNQNTSLPKYHKDNLYYCSVLFNNRAFVASTRLSTCVNNFHTVNLNQSSNGGGFLSQSMGHTTNGHGLDLDLSSSYSAGCKYASKDAIWDDSFTFDNLPLDVKEMKLCLFVNAKASNFSASFVNNFKKIGSNSGAKMLDPVLIGCVNIRLEDLLNKGLCEAWYNVEPMVHLGNNSNGTPDQNWHKSVADCVEPIGANQSSTGSSTSSSSSSTSSAGEAVAPFRASGCQLRVKIRFCQEKINLNELNYRKLSEYLLNESEHTNLCHLYDQIMPSTERAHFVQSLLKFFIVKNKIINMLKSFLLCEIKRCADLSTLFRPATMCTSLMDHYMRVRCEEFLHVALEQPLKSIFKSDFSSSTSATSSSSTASTSFNSSSTSQQSSSSPDMSFELDPSKCPDKEQRDRNLENFKEALTVLINAICSPTAISLFPNELKYLFFFIRQQVHLKWQKQKPTSDEKSAKIYCVSAFVFLRLICPALLNPKSFNLQFFNPASSGGAKSTSTSLEQSRPHRLHHNPNETFTLAHLAAKFSLFSPSFMFTLTPPVHRLSLFKSRSSSTLLTSNYNTHEFQSSNNQINCFNVSSSSQSASSTNGSSSTNGLTSYTNNSTNSWSSSSSSSFANQYNLYERNIKLLAKVIQTMANKTECKEPFMMPLSRFLNENKSNLSEFIDSISNMNEFNYHKNDHSLLVADDCIDCNELSDDSDERDEDLSNYNLRQQFKYATCKYLAIIHRILYSLVPQMKMYLSKLNSSTPGASDDEDRYENGNDDQDQDDDDNDETKTLNETDVSFAASLTYLISLLEDVHEKTK